MFANAVITVTDWTVSTVKLSHTDTVRLHTFIIDDSKYATPGMNVLNRF